MGFNFNVFGMLGVVGVNFLVVFNFGLDIWEFNGYLD